MTSYQRRRNELNIKGAEQHMNNSGLGTQPTPFSKKAMIKIRPNGFFFFWGGGGAQAPCSYAFVSYINGFIESKSYEFVKMLDEKMTFLVFVRCHFHFGDFIRIIISFKTIPQDTFKALIVTTS